MIAYYSDPSVTLYNGDCRSMPDLPDESVQMVVTSPPYWGLRKYAGLPDLVWGGDRECQHQFILPTSAIQGNNSMVRGKDETDSGNFAIPKFKDTDMKQRKEVVGAFCSLCGAWQGQLGLEPTPELYISHLVEIFREVKRVLRKDGVVFLNIGDTYYGGNKGYGDTRPPGTALSNIHGDIFGEPNWLRAKKAGVKVNMKPKDLCLIPFRLAIALQEDGWWVRSVIIWSKNNPMPESVTDRPTESHEYILMLTKSAKYYYDQEAVREPYQLSSIDRVKYPVNAFGASEWGVKLSKTNVSEHTDVEINPSGRNLRSVWAAPKQLWRLRQGLSASDRAFVLGELLKREILSSKNGNDNDQNE